MPKLAHSDDFMMRSLGARLRFIRKERKLSMVNVADQLDITWQQIQKYELGKNMPSIVAVRKMAAIYNVKPCEIFGCDIRFLPIGIS